MELYAKSKAKQLSIKEVEALKETLESFLDSLEGILTPKEEQIIIQQIQKIQNQKEEKQKTLKEHEEDIVKCAEAFFRGYGKYFVIRHDNGLETVYGHLSKQLVEENQLVKAGEVIGLGGNTGRSTGSHLHFETRFLGIAINPIYMFDFPKQDIVADTYTFRKAKGVKRAGSHDTQVADGTIRYHKVKSGDTLSRIAKLRGVSVSTLCKLNRIKPTTTLRIGQVLRCS